MAFSSACVRMNGGINASFSYFDRVIGAGVNVARLGELFAKNTENQAHYVRVRDEGNVLRSYAGAVRLFAVFGDFVNTSAFMKTNDDGSRSLRDPVEIAINVSHLFARVFCFASLFELGRHAKSMGQGIVCAFTALITLAFAHTVRVAWSEYTRFGEISRGTVLDLIESGLDLVSMPSELLMGLNTNPVVGIISSLISLIASIFAAIRPIALN